MHRQFILILAFALVSLPIISAATVNRVQNGDFELAGDDPTLIPGWRDDHCEQGRARCTVALAAIGVDGTRALAIVGPEVRRSDRAFPVTGAEELELRADVFEMVDSSASQGKDVAHDSVIALEFTDSAGRGIQQILFHCDEYADLVDNDELDGSASCTTQTGYVHMVIPDPSIDCTLTPSATCLKYHNAILVPSAAFAGRLTLGGGSVSLTLGPDLSPLSKRCSDVEPLDDRCPVIHPMGLDAPVTVVAFDNIFVGN